MYRAQSLVGQLRPLVSRGYKSLASMRKNALGTAHGFDCTSRAYASKSGSFLNGSSAVYVDEMYQAWLADPASVHKSWDVCFKNMENGALPEDIFIAPPGAWSGIEPTIGSAGSALATQAAPGGETITKHQAVQNLIKAHQVRGHNIAKLDPLNMFSADLDDSVPPELTLEGHNLSEADLDREFSLDGVGTYIGGDSTKLTLREIVQRLKSAYSHNIGVESADLFNEERTDWIRRRFESPGIQSLNKEEKRILMARLIRSTKFEEFLAKKFISEKRFGLEGCEVLIPAMKCIIDESNKRGVDSFIIGMPHRGRLNVLANVCRKELDKILNEFNSELEVDDEGSGDVKYHLGMSHERINRTTNKPVRIAVCANPSHLEAVDPIAIGKCKAEQYYNGDVDGKKTMAIILHGDAAFSGQGVVYETLHLSDLNDFTTHGVIHIVVNNQIGFTTDPRFSRSSPYCTDVARVNRSAPIVHVNADAPEAVQHVAKVAAEWRATYGNDFCIDLVCYRRNGHNEQDNPFFTQPRMYRAIEKQPTVLDQYVEKLVNEGTITQAEYEEEDAKYARVLNEAFESTQKTKASLVNREWLDSPWEDFFKPEIEMVLPKTGCDEQTLRHVGKLLSQSPPGYKLLAGHNRIFKNRAKLLEKGVVDWALGESMAYGTLLLEGHHVRLSGQDCQRGTFSHRHHVIHNPAKDMDTFNPLNNLSDDQAKYVVVNSSLSEYAVLGFETGYAMHNPNSLVLWEAQFGDFANTAQVIFDQFLSSGQDKWVRQNGLVCLLPHGYEGMGPEHSSARIERFLQGCNDDEDRFPKSDNFEMQQLHECNWQIVQCSTPANFYHVLRRQMKLPMRKPLIVFTPKRLLREPNCVSPLELMTGEHRFQRVIPDDSVASQNPEQVQRLIFCTGRMFYDLHAQRETMKDRVNSVVITRIEQISPFPFDLVKEEIAKYPHADVMFVQEEHKNMGPWHYVKDRFKTVFRKMGQEDREIKYVGRAASASTACGKKNTHLNEESSIKTRAFAFEGDF